MLAVCADLSGPTYFKRKLESGVVRISHDIVQHIVRELAILRLIVDGVLIHEVDPQKGLCTSMAFQNQVD